jgi:hypothetical protein
MFVVFKQADFFLQLSLVFIFDVVTFNGSVDGNMDANDAMGKSTHQ